MFLQMSWDHRLKTLGSTKPQTNHPDVTQTKGKRKMMSEHSMVWLAAD